MSEDLVTMSLDGMRAVRVSGGAHLAAKPHRGFDNCRHCVFYQNCCGPPGPRVLGAPSKAHCLPHFRPSGRDIIWVLADP